MRSRPYGFKRTLKFFICTPIESILLLNQMVKYSSRTLNRTFAALADPTRRRILAHLAQGDQCVTDLAKPHSMSLPAVSKHLRVLEKAGLLRRRRLDAFTKCDSMPNRLGRLPSGWRSIGSFGRDRSIGWPNISKMRTGHRQKGKRNKGRSTCVPHALLTLPS